MDLIHFGQNRTPIALGAFAQILFKFSPLYNYKSIGIYHELIIEFLIDISYLYEIKFHNLNSVYG